MFSYSAAQKIIFKPSQKINYCTDSYGLAPCKAEKIQTSFRDLGYQKTPAFFNIKNTLQYAAGFAIFFVAGALSYRSMILYTTEPTEKTQVASFLPQKNNTPAAEFFVKNPSEKKTIVKKYYIVLGAFKLQKNILKYKKHILNKGFTPEVFPKNEQGVSKVVLGGLHSKKEAEQLLHKAKKLLQKDAWIFTKKL